MDKWEAPQRLRGMASWQLAQAALAARTRVAEQLSGSGASRSEFAMLATLEEFGPCSQADLGRRIGLDRKDIATLTAAAEASGRIGRAPDPADRRRNVVTLTTAGGRRLRELTRLLEAAQSELLEPLADAERAELLRLLALLAR